MDSQQASSRKERSSKYSSTSTTAGSPQNKQSSSSGTLTKGGTRALRDLDLFRPDRDAFASTLTSLDGSFSRKWEASAALPPDRITALQSFHDAGIFTWVSLELTLDVESSMEIVRRTHSFVDLYKIGRVNYLPITKTTDWRDYTLRMIDLCHRLAVNHYIKKDLQGFSSLRVSE
jgi:hypothetical protein